jgi:hypothetical protein
VLDVEEGGPGKRSITSLDSATSITSDMSCFLASDGKERCYIDTLPGECDVVNSFASDSRRHLGHGPNIPNNFPTGNQGVKASKPTSNMYP